MNTLFFAGGSTLLLAWASLNASGQPSDASLREAMSAGPAISLPVSGLTKENASEVEKSLRGIMHTTYECKSCDTKSQTKKECPDCQAAMTKVDTAALLSLKANVEEETISFAVAPAMEIRLTQLEKALQPSRVEIPHNTLILSRHADLLLTGVESDDAGAKLAQGLEDSKLFSKASVIKDPASKGFLALVEQGEKPVNLDDASKLVTKLNAKVHVTDVRWNGAMEGAGAGSSK